jgi:hypothetical protein
LEQKKLFGEILEQAGSFGIQIGQFGQISGYWKFKKSGIFSIFGQIWQLFFSKCDFEQNWS